MNRYAIPLFFTLLSVGMYIEYIDPTIVSIQADRAKREEYIKFIQEANEAASQLEALKQKQSDFPVGYDQALSTILPPTVDPTRLIIDVDGVAQLRGLTILSPAVNRASEGAGGYVKNSLTFNLSAPYAIFRSFLHDLESSLALRDATSISFTSAELEDGGAIKNPEQKVLSYTFTIVTYSRVF